MNEYLYLSPTAKAGVKINLNLSKTDPKSVMLEKAFGSEKTPDLRSELWMYDVRYEI